MQKIQGRCLCGAVRYRSDAAPLLTAICNCKNCQRQTGTAFSISGRCSKGRAHHGRSTARHLSGCRRQRATCVAKILLKVRVANIHGRRTHSDDDWLKAGTLDDTSWLQPQVNVWCDSAQPWVQMSDAIPRIPRNPPPA